MLWYKVTLYKRSIHIAVKTDYKTSEYKHHRLVSIKYLLKKLLTLIYLRIIFEIFHSECYVFPTPTSYKVL